MIQPMLLEVGANLQVSALPCPSYVYLISFSLDLTQAVRSPDCLDLLAWY